ncbi:MAG: type IV secretion system DotC family protein [Alphaproteobacteria bacterium]|nr:type IV secretion system DotC family protein [Alphaproteobacteria bacterium]
MRKFFAFFILTILIFPAPYQKGYAGLPVESEEPIVDIDMEPVDMETLMTYKGQGEFIKNTLPLDIRLDAVREAATSFGARGGLAKRTYEIRKELKTRERYLDSVFNFAQLLVAAPSGFMIEPPIISESQNAMIIDIGGQTAAVSDRIYDIVRNAKIVSAPRMWRQYLEREWGEVIPPPDILLPQNEEEQFEWDKHIKIGWDHGYSQANEIFERDLARLTTDFEGMVRYRLLLAQGMISPPYALQLDRGVTGRGDQMRIGDRAVQITGVPTLITETKQWKPASR